MSRLCNSIRIAHPQFAGTPPAATTGPVAGSWSAITFMLDGVLYVQTGCGNVVAFGVDRNVPHLSKPPWML
jgi:hypothetical protein